MTINRLKSILGKLANRSSRQLVATAVALSCAASSGLVATSAQADDIDIFDTSGGTSNRPNLLLLFDMSGSMNWDLNGVDSRFSGEPSRADLLKDALATVMDDTAGLVNMGVALWNSRSSGIKWPITDLNQEARELDASIPAGVTAKDVIENLVRTAAIGGGTAPVNALFEAANYFRGGPVRRPDLGDMPASSNRPFVWDDGLNSYAGGAFYSANPVAYRPSNAFTTVFGGQWRGANYRSPLNSCQSNHMLLLTDGQPTVFNIQDEVEALIGRPCADLSESIFGQAPGNSPYGNCGPELADFLASNDQNPAIKGSTVGLYTIGLGLQGTGAAETEDYMELLATNGQGGFYTVDNAEALQAAFQDIIKNVAGESENFTELSVDLDSASFSNDDRAFFSLFKPTPNAAWTGNTKGYFVDSNGLEDINGDPAVDVQPSGAIFDNGAQSFWSTAPDGNKIHEGGASGKLDASSRLILTYTGAADPSNEPLTAAENRLVNNNPTARLRPSWFGVNDKSQRDSLINWLYNAPMGDPLHTKPFSVRYSDSTTVIYSMTNQGLLHAFDATTPVLRNGNSNGGEELFSFIPRELLINLPALETNTVGGDHIYGLDGGMTVWHEEFANSNDGIVNNGESVYLFIGMRRGGEHYYALDISNYQDPRLLWQISSGDPGFNNLAQSWSRMSLVTLYDDAYPDNRRSSLVFGGGYDQPRLDDRDRRRTSSGNAIYAVDALSGDLIWSVSNSGATETDANMRFALASDLKVIDSNGNGFADRIYAGDLGGQLWRVDINDHDSVDSEVEVNLLAQLGNDSRDQFQPFFAAPSVSLDQVNGVQTLYISIGSGNRDQPLQNQASNRMFVIKDENLETGSPASAPDVITLADMYDATDDRLSNPALAADEAQLLEEADGWYITLEGNEKAMTETLVFQNQLMFTTVGTWMEIDSRTDCPVLQTSSKFYAMNLRDGTPLLDTGPDDGGLDMGGIRYKEISSTGIPTTPTLVFPKDSNDTAVFAGKENLGSLGTELQKVYWWQQN